MGQKVTQTERTAAIKGATLFAAVMANKKTSISTIMQENYPGIAKNAQKISSSQKAAQIQFNYNLFIYFYLNQDDNGKWTRKDKMWTKDANNNYVPLSAPKIP